MKKLCIIPARGGSKRIPRKNIKKFLGKHVIGYSIELALDSNLFDEIIVSTDDVEIAEISKEYGAKVPFLRSNENSDDNATTFDVLEEVINYYNVKKVFFKYICCLYPAAPLIKMEYFKLCYNQILKNKNTSVFPVVKFDYPILKAFSMENGNISFLYPENNTLRTQDIKSYYLSLIHI